MPGLWERLFRPAESTRSDRDRADAPQRLQNVGRRRVEVEGTVLDLRTRPTAGGAPSLVVRVETAEGVIELVWLGRRSLAGVQEDRRVRARGVLTTMHGRPTIFNPDYELLPDEMRTP